MCEYQKTIDSLITIDYCADIVTKLCAVLSVFHCEIQNKVKNDILGNNETLDIPPQC